MTNDEWRSCTNFLKLDDYLRPHWSERKRWLFACACVRRVWHLLSDSCRDAQLVIERHVEGAATDAELLATFKNYYSAPLALSIPGSVQAAEAIGKLGSKWRWRTAEESIWPRSETSMSPYDFYSVVRSVAEGLAQTMTWEEARAMQCVLLRDIFRKPDVERPAFDPNWAEFNLWTVANLAETIYEDRTFELMPILADALEDAGCTDEHLVEHCRKPGPHVRGCWALELCMLRK